MNQKNVREFSELAFKGKKGEDAELPKSPQKLDEKDVAFISKMVQDEMEELKNSRCLGEQADALADAIYYLFDCAAKHGINLDPILDIVHSSNLEKVRGKKAIFNQEGKVEKPAGWASPDLLVAKEIERQQNEGAYQ